MTPAEFWMIYDVKRPDKDQVSPDWDAMLEKLNEAESTHELKQVAMHGFNW